MALVLGAPITVLLRAVSAPRARRLTGVLRSVPLRVAAHPVTALALSAGTLPLRGVRPLRQDRAGAGPRPGHPGVRASGGRQGVG
ncbi:hypothetical protein GWI34_21775 [Actinomadura sp. DSM 109109]|nr:hypothetical protein [Actinomadura lepetitiana]